MKPLLLLCVALCPIMTKTFAQCNTSNNLALGKLATASTSESGSTLPAAAVDGNVSTRWSSQFSDPQFITVDLGAITSLCEVTLLWENAYATSFQIDISNDELNWTTVASVSGNTSTTNIIPISGMGRFVRMTGLTRATSFGYSLYEFRVYGSAATPFCSMNLALDQTAFESDQENAAFPAENAFDGNPGTRWSSAFSDPQFLYVDLGARYPLCSVEITWEAAYATEYRIDLSDDGLNWTTKAHITGNSSLTNTVPITGEARYVRMYGLQRATGFGYSIWEMKVFGNSIVLPVKWVSFSGKINNEKKVRLDWITANESKHAYYEIQRKSGAEADFMPIGIILSQEQTSNNQKYTYIDKTPKEGMSYYRIRQVDADEHSSFSKTIAVNNNSNTSGILIYPNPVANQLFIKDASQPIDFISIYSADGRKLQETCCIEKGQTAVVQMGSYPQGTYIVQIVTARNVDTRKIVKE